MNEETFNIRLDKSIIKISSLNEPSDEKEYRATKTPEERMAAIEIMRQIVYGYDTETARLERVFEILNRKSTT